MISNDQSHLLSDKKKVDISDLIVITTLLLLVIGMQFIKPSEYNASFHDMRFNFPTVKRFLPVIFNYMLILVLYPLFIFIASKICIKAQINHIKTLLSYGTVILLSYLVALSLELFIGIPRPNTIHICGNITYESCIKKMGKVQAKSQFLSFPSSEATVLSASSYFITNILDIIWNDSSLISSIIKLFPFFYIFVNMAVLIVSAENSPIDVSLGTLIGIIVSKSII
ncbi:Lipid phosphate phosphatase [Tritrichomonas foetus]|uniref:Lipid phosphate phosphatase n=1 Tax=Tritrichomonas foetus TaxID=1144522 RepID=A0A1J4J092_9EUKA|nr:Lipid phosphate phosphatase [Tritrichomonas foetus]|eukprot:OHS93016.1 Lipid phosphate phosphatase [Tritrichomonas foetus]